MKSRRREKGGRREDRQQVGKTKPEEKKMGVGGGKGSNPSKKTKDPKGS